MKDTLAIRKFFLIGFVIFIMNVTTTCIASNDYRWNGLWASGGIGYGVQNLKVDMGRYFSFDKSENVAFFDARTGFNLSEHIGLFFQGTASGIGSHTAGFVNLYFRPITRSPIFVFGGIGFYDPIDFQASVSGGAGIDLSFLSAEIRTYRGVGRDSESSGVIFTINLLHSISR